MLSEHTRLPAQYGHPLTFLLAILDSHSWPLSQTHQAFLLLPRVTIFGERSPFLVGCHCLAKVGFKTAKLLSEHTRLPEQYGHPPFCLEFITASHSWPLSQTHQTLFLPLGATIFGERSPFLVGCHCLAKVGFKTFKLLSEPIFWPEQYGQPLGWLVRALDPIAASHSWPLSQTHQAFLPLPWGKLEGNNGLFLS